VVDFSLCSLFAILLFETGSCSLESRSWFRTSNLDLGASDLLRALIFDFDGIIVDSEPIILKLTQEMAAAEGWQVSEEEYYRDYLALDDRTIVEHLYSSHGKALDSLRCNLLVEEKARKYEQIIKNGLPSMPGAVDFVRRASQIYLLAIASGSLRQEIEHLLETLQLRGNFQVLATADDCARSKPDPEVYLKALTRLARLAESQTAPLQPAECLAIEDAPGGVDAAHAAGLKCLALAHSRPLDELRHADWLFRGFNDINMEAIARTFR
jgi:HAD superfamily hydrolase (TIGR01509 family)